MIGKIKRLNERGFGFLSPVGEDRSEAEHFFHYRDLIDIQFNELKPGQTVTFDSAVSHKGLVAKNVKVSK